MDEYKDKTVCVCGLTPCTCQSWQTASSDEIVAGDLIGQRYQVLREVGRGSTATIFLVRNALTDQLLAMKIMNKEVVHDEETNKRFELEARTISTLHHDNLVSLYDFGRSAAGHPYFVMDFVEGKNLFEVLSEEGRLPAKRACRIFVQVCDAMEYAHQVGLIHRDLKPSNVMLCLCNGEERVKVVDFGIVKFVQSSNQELQDLKLTQEGKAVGSPRYMSPEQCLGHGLDARSDVYSLGCVMHEVLSGSLRSTPIPRLPPSLSR